MTDAAHAADAAEGPLIAYLCAEFGLDAGRPLYSGGLGVLAGDHLRAASDLGLPLVGVGLLYRQGYFCQGIDAEGWQTESYPLCEPERMGMAPACGADGRPVEVTVEMGDGPVRARVWRLDVGRVPLYLLDSDVAGNPPAARAITARLYGGDREARLCQELLLGVGGPRALAALGLEPSVVHLNEGHSALSVLERVRALRAGGLGWEEAFARVRGSTVFTTHTPVPAGNEEFAPELVARHLAPLAREIGLSMERLLALGRVREEEGEGDGAFGLTPLALRGSRFANGVSALHGEVARGMWAGLWPGRSPEEVPIGAITNGVHGPTWTAPALADPDRLSDAELWAVHRRLKNALVASARRRVGRACGLDPDALLVGFARRFATYKRADLVLSDPERLAAMVGDPERPVQLVFAGKAHPADEGGKLLIQRVVRLAAEPRWRGRVVFLPGYDLDLARELVQGVDVWLNTPARPQEASGTSGMKAAMNGVPHLSVLDGWWAEAHDLAAGWALGRAGGGGDGGPDDKDEDGGGGPDDPAEAQALYGLLEGSVVPLFYARDAGGVPGGFVAMMRAAIALARGRFDARRMVREYAERAYLLDPASLGPAHAHRHTSDTLS